MTFKTDSEGKWHDEPEEKIQKVVAKTKKGKPIVSGLVKGLNSKVIVKRIVKSPKVIVNIAEREPAEYKSTYFKNEWEGAKKSLFFQ